MGKSIVSCFFDSRCTWAACYYEKSRDLSCVQAGGVISRHFSGQTLLSKDRQCCESWRDAELGVRAVCAVGDTTDEDR